MSKKQVTAQQDLAEELRVLRAALMECHQELSSLRDENAALVLKAEAAEISEQQAFEQLQMVRSTIAWKLATPQRLIREILRS